MPVSEFATLDPYTYLSGFHNHHETESVSGALPIGQNSPQTPPLGLYAEKLSGSSFTAPRRENHQTWLYRILPACARHTPFRSYEEASEEQGNGNTRTSWDLRVGGKGKEAWLDVPNQLRWDPFTIEAQEQGSKTDWVRGLKLLAGQGDPVMKSGLGIYVYNFHESMAKNAAFYSADGDFLIVPQNGALNITTELGRLIVRPLEICVIPRGVRYRVELVEEEDQREPGARGYVLELFEQGHFELPELGPIGSNGLANAADFQCPVANFEDSEGNDKDFDLFAKFGGRLFVAKQDHTPFDVVAWRGNYYPYKYDLGRFNTIGTISYDHPDPSIFTVLTAPSARAGTAIADFVIFPPRWLVGEDTFRPPYFHRNTMSEFMGMITGYYDGKSSGFAPGGASLHNTLSGHGPDAETHEKASEMELKPQMVGKGSMAFMFESCLILGVTEWGLSKTQKDYNKHSWSALERKFAKTKNLPVNGKS